MLTLLFDGLLEVLHLLKLLYLILEALLHSVNCIFGFDHEFIEFFESVIRADRQPEHVEFYFLILFGDLKKRK